MELRNITLLLRLRVNRKQIYLKASEGKSELWGHQKSSSSESTTVKLERIGALWLMLDLKPKEEELFGDPLKDRVELEDDLKPDPNDVIDDDGTPKSSNFVKVFGSDFSFVISDDEEDPNDLREEVPSVSNFEKLIGDFSFVIMLNSGCL